MVCCIGRKVKPVGKPLEAPKGHWETKNRRMLHISDMTDTHLLNALKMLDRHFAAHWFSYGMIRAVDLHPFPPMFNGEMAQMAAEYEYEAAIQDTVLKAKPEDCIPKYKELFDEAKKRKLKWRRLFSKPSSRPE